MCKKSEPQAYLCCLVARAWAQTKGSWSLVQPSRGPLTGCCSTGWSHQRPPSKMKWRPDHRANADPRPIVGFFRLKGIRFLLSVAVSRWLGQGASNAWGCHTGPPFQLCGDVIAGPHSLSCYWALGRASSAYLRGACNFDPWVRKQALESRSFVSKRTPGSLGRYSHPLPNNLCIATVALMENKHMAVDNGRWLGGYNVHDFSDGCTEGLDFTTVQYINTAKQKNIYTHVHALSIWIMGNAW